MKLNMRFTTVLWLGLALTGGANHSLASPDTGGGDFALGTEDASEDPMTTGAARQPRPDFSGDWVLNAEASDDPREKAKEAMRASRQTRGGGTGGMGRGGGMGSGRQCRGTTGGMKGGGGRSSGELSARLAPAQELHITHQDPSLQIADENHQLQRLFTDFRGASVSARGALTQRVAVAGWEGKVLVVETTLSDRKLVQSYRIDAGTGQLVIATEAQVSEAPAFSYRLVYERIQPEPGGGQAGQTVRVTQGETQ